MSKKKPALDLPVAFGGVSIGDGTARLGIKIDRAALTIDKADASLCGRRLAGRVVLGKGDSAQQELINDRQHCVASVFDVKRIGVAPKNISAGLTFSLEDIDVRELSIFAKKSGRLIVDTIAELPDEDEDGDDDDAADEDDDEDEGEEASSNGDWRSIPLSKIYGGDILKILRKKRIRTVGDLAKYTSSGKKLTDIDGIGPGRAGNISERMDEWWKKHPELASEPEASVPVKQ